MMCDIRDLLIIIIIIIIIIITGSLASRFYHDYLNSEIDIFVKSKY